MPSAHGKAYSAFDESNGPQRFGSLKELVQYANSVTGEPVWVDVQGETVEEKRRLMDDLSIGMHGGHGPSSAVVDELVEPSENDVVQLQPVYASFAQGVVSCAGSSAMLDTSDNPSLVVEEEDTQPGDGPEEGGRRAVYSAEALDRSNGLVWCTFFATEHLLLTLHRSPFVGLAEMMRSLEMQRLSRKEAHAATTSPSVPRASPTTAAAGEDFPGVCRPFTVGFALATLVTFTSETMLPDPTALLSEVDCIDEMVLLIAPGTRDQPDLLRRVALLRRRISAYRARLYLKEKLLQELVTPAMRGSFVSRDTAFIIPLYKDSLDKITQVADRLDDARDILNQANLNFVTGVSMRMSQSSANMDFKMQILGQVATICLPLNLVASIFGMNCTVPFQSDTHPTLYAFFGVVGVMLLWCLVCSIPTIRGALGGNQAKAIVPTDT